MTQATPVRQRQYTALRCGAVLTAAVVLLSVLPLPPAISVSLSGFFPQFPLTLDTLAPAFHVPGWLLVSRFSLALLGGIFHDCRRKCAKE